MSAIGTKRARRVALQMSAFDPKRPLRDYLSIQRPSVYYGCLGGPISGVFTGLAMP